MTKLHTQWEIRLDYPSMKTWDLIFRCYYKTHSGYNHNKHRKEWVEWRQKKLGVFMEWE